MTKTLAAIALIASGHCAASTDAAQREVLILGDSLSAAYGLAIEQGWVALAAQQLKKTHPDAILVNASISGETSGGGLARLPALLKRHSFALVVIELGANDGLRGYPPATLGDNLIAMGERAKAAGAKVIMVEVEIPANYGRRYIKALGAQFERAATTAGASLVPFLALDIGKDPTLLQSDGLHPTAKAQPLIATHLLPFIRAELDDNE